MEVVEKYRWHCIELAQNGKGHAAPNPMVGAVVVCEGKIIGEGYHVQCGKAHAEVNAIAAVKDKELLKQSTIYVSLEPCSHYGKTPPCADLIIRMGIPRVVIGCQDPFSEVAGRGIQRLRDAGCEVVVGILEAECRHLIRRFITFNTLKRPFITLKWAQSADGFIDYTRTEGSAVLLSNPLNTMRVHKLRAEHKAILVGSRTALLDNPSLTVRHWWGDHPLRILLDNEGILPHTCTLFDGNISTLVFTTKQNICYPNTKTIVLKQEEDLLPQLLNELYQLKIQSLMVEGGSATLQSFIDAGLWDEAFVEIAPTHLREGVTAPTLSGQTNLETQCSFGHTVLCYQRNQI